MLRSQNWHEYDDCCQGHGSYDNGKEMEITIQSSGLHRDYLRQILCLTFPEHDYHAHSVLAAGVSFVF